LANSSRCGAKQPSVWFAVALLAGSQGCPDLIVNLQSAICNERRSALKVFL
jgi:hypothetical protein